MEHLKIHLDDTTSSIVLQFLINDDDYTSFRCEDIIKLENKITEWDLCLYWAIENNRSEIFSYIHLEIAPKGFITEKMWNKSMHVAAKSGNIWIFNRILTVCDSMMQNGVAQSAGMGGHLRMIQRLEYSFGDLSDFVFVGAGKRGHLDIFITYLAKYNSSVMSSDTMKYRWGSMIRSIVKENHLHILIWIGEHSDKVRCKTDWEKCVKQSIYLNRFDIFKYSLSKVSNMTDDKWKDIINLCIAGDSAIEPRKIPENALEMLQCIGSHDECEVDWTSHANGAIYHAQFDTFKYCLSKNVDIRFICSIRIGCGGSIEIAEFIEHRTHINWDECLSSAVEHEHINMIKHAVDRGANNLYDCMIAASEGRLSSLICIENELEKRNIYITTAVYNKCMLKATCSGHIEIVKHVSKHSYNWNQSMRDAAYYKHLDILKHSECQGADDWEGTLKYINRFTPYNDEEITKYLKSKISLYERCGLAKRRRLIN